MINAIQHDEFRIAAGIIADHPAIACNGAAARLRVPIRRFANHQFLAAVSHAGAELLIGNLIVTVNGHHNILRHICRVLGHAQGIAQGRIRIGDTEATGIYVTLFQGNFHIGVGRLTVTVSEDKVIFEAERGNRRPGFRFREGQAHPVGSLVRVLIRYIGNARVNGIQFHFTRQAIAAIRRDKIAGLGCRITGAKIQRIPDLHGLTAGSLVFDTCIEGNKAYGISRLNGELQIIIPGNPRRIRSVGKVVLGNQVRVGDTEVGGELLTLQELNVYPFTAPALEPP